MTSSYVSLFARAPKAEAQAPIHLRYEDLTQDGQLKITALLQAVGRTGFQQLWVKHPLIASYRAGVVPILTRLVMQTDVEPTLLGSELQASGGLTLAREDDASGAPQALFLNMFAELHGQRGRSFGPQPEGAGERVRLGRVFAEHTFTKPFAPAGQRKVQRFDVPGQPALPDAKHTRRSVSDVLEPEAGDRLLDAVFRADAAPWVFGMTHTDHNQHVNSLVYASLFEDAALRRLAEHGVDTRLHAASIELVYRKPCFAGERVVCQLRAFERDGEHGAVGYVGSEGVSADRAHCALRLAFRRAARSATHA